MAAKNKLITVHGLNTDGQWQKEITGVLGYFFEPFPIKYPQYRWFGFTKVALTSWLTLLVGTVIGLLSIFLFHSGVLLTVAVVVLALAAVARWRVGATVRNLKSQ